MPADATIVPLRSDKAEAPEARRDAPRERPEQPLREQPKGPAETGSGRRWLRPALFVLLPFVLIAGATWYVTGGQVMSTDNAYVEADKVGISREDLLLALQEVRGSHRVTSQNPEEQYQALEKYGRDLTDAARAGKIDPVIGRDDEMTDPVVLAKRDAAAAWVKTVNTSDDVQETWAYLLASESVIKNAANWTALRAAAQTFR